MWARLELEEYEAMYKLENDFWWYVGQRRMADSLLSSCSLDPTKTRILDVGCGTGANILFLQRYGTVTGLDLSPEALRFCAQRGITNVLQGSATALPFDNNSFDLATSFDVIYHMAIEDDLVALKEMHRVLVPNGFILVRVPAYDSLRGNHDIAVHTRHRYTAGELGMKLSSVGFKIERLTYTNTLLFPLIALKRMTESRKPQQGIVSDVRPISSVANGVLTRVMSLEAALLKRARFPFGLSVVCLARKV